LSLVAETQVLTWMTAHSTVLFPAVFFGVALFEAFRPARPQTTPLALRWFGNVGVFFLGWPLLKAIPFLSVTGAAMIAGQHGVGLFNVLSIPAVVAIPAGVVVLDLTLYWEHRLLHWFPPFWRITRFITPTPTSMLRATSGIIRLKWSCRRFSMCWW
jgi:sterol desaturase/sphingolipid hydroxylase (fatty acid hydroxylase superfamily)